MSMAPDGQHVTCDGAGCDARAALPVALRSVLSRDEAGTEISGWLFVTERTRTRHFCPDCATQGWDDLASQNDQDTP